MSKDFDKWIELRDSSADKYGDKLCYCGHTDMCSCSSPDITLFEESVKNKTIILDDPKNGWSDMSTPPKEKATELYNKFYNYKSHPNSVETRKMVAKEHALHCVEELWEECTDDKEKYWESVQKELFKIN